MSDPSSGPANGSRPATAPLLAPRLARAFKAPRARRAALIPYLTGGHPDLDTCDRLIDTVLQAGADIVELGIPFSDPIADGPVVQRSTHQALLAGVTPDDVFQLAAAHSGTAPFVLLTYVNSVLAYGPDRFFTRAASSGVEALVIPDLPLDEAAAPDFPPKPPTEAPSAREEPSSPASRALAAQAAAAEGPDGGLVALAASRGVSLVPMATPTSTEARLDMVAAAATSFVYCVAVTGVTGARTEVGSQLPGLLQRLRARTEAPLAVGFGISTPQQAGAVAGLADGVIIGSALIDTVAHAANADEACRAAAGLIQSSSAAIAAG